MNRSLFITFLCFSFFLVQICHAEFRAAWVATVFNINYPSSAGLSVAEQKRELLRLIDTAKGLGLNALVFQVRPEADALYQSSLEPWSRFLTGTQGRSPGFDPLAFLITEAHKRGIEVHAWFNPFRAASDFSKPRAPSHVYNKLKPYIYRVNNTLWMDPGSSAVHDHVVGVVVDVVTRYDIDGVHFDDYFYPYPIKAGQSTPFPDERTFREYVSKGGKLSRANWRRDNVNRFIERIHKSIKAQKPSVQFGVSPFGIYTKGQPTTVKVELDQLNEIYSDPKKWLIEGWVDYLAPQLYWMDKSPQSFSELLKWWRSKETNPRRIPIYPGIAVARLNTPHNWPAAEISKQVRITRQIDGGADNGYLFWNIANLTKNRKGIADILRTMK